MVRRHGAQSRVDKLLTTTESLQMQYKEIMLGQLREDVKKKVSGMEMFKGGMDNGQSWVTTHC